MKKCFLVFVVLFFVTVFTNFPAAHAQIFQNNNTDCESLATITTSAGSVSTSIACKNISASADFNGDGFVDCAASVASAIVTGDKINTVFMNKGSTATSCASGTGDQFETALGYAMSGLDLSGDLSSIVVGNLVSTSSPFSDMAEASVTVGGGKRISIAPSISTGGFGSNGSTITTDNASWSATAGETAIAATSADPALALLDCNGDGNLDSIIATEVTTAGIAAATFDVNINNGSGFANVGASNFFNLGVGGGKSIVSSVTVGDFNNDKIPDAAFAINDSGGSPNAVLIVCINNGSCNFSCNNNTEVDLTSAHAGANPAPTSIAAGDFNGDGNLDVAITEPGLAQGSRGIHYYFGNGSGGFQSTSTHVSFPTLSGSDNASPVVIKAGCFNNDNQVDTATSYTRSSGGNASVEVVTSNGSGGLDAPTTLSLSNPGGFTAVGTLAGIDTADFDNQGGDDIIVLGTATAPASSQRTAFIFMNALETFAANAGTDQAIALNTAVTFSGASCTVTPDDPGAQFDVSWSANGASNVTFTNTNTLTPTFSASASGVYNLTLTCVTLCNRVSKTDNVTIVVGNASGLLTQGGCVGNTLAPAMPNSLAVIYGIWMFAPIAAFGFKRKKREYLNSKVLKILLIFVFLASGIFVASPVHALTQSFSTEFFKPAVDDSDYLALYSSPTLKQKNYHFGLWLDYAKNPYEFCNCSGVRQTGIVNGELTGNFVGAYGVKDWFEVGGRLPVYFWDAIRAPVLGRPNENNIELGDFELDLKFKLLDRDKHHIGLSIVPFMTTPTATRAVHDFTGNGNFTGGAKLVLDGKLLDRLTLAANAGFTGRGTVTDVGGNKIGSNFMVGAGFDVDIIKKQLKIIGESHMETVVSNFFSKKRTMPAEARLGIRYRFKNGINANLAGGMAYSNGIGNPDFRAIAGITYTSGRINEFTLKEPTPDIYELKDEDVWAKANVGDELKLRDKIYFDYDKASIRPISKPTLDKLALFLKNHPEFKKLRIEGNTCDLGSVKYNLNLSKRRATSVDQYLVSQGVDPSRLEIVGNGKSKPLVANTDEASREQNRRVQIYVAEKQ